MATIQIPTDFKEFLTLLNDRGVEYLLIGGYAVGYYGYPRATGDIDIWIAFQPHNIRSVADALKAFGFNIPEPNEAFLSEGQIFGLGISPLRIEILTTIDGVEFAECYRARTVDTVDEIQLNIIGLQELRKNKAASGRLKDMNDLQNLPDS
jgi:hypothetical protein